ncbi:multidrug MFS transporter [Novimethylophilus kurashikiensis]|uniref:Multidrug MFS transporter n=1 Tax=Novimethylophilus kurashikiensis TaxID=1825523 RepID=A0A2R5FA14_9PROT|nr:nucleoside-diphosphate sugar epimerase/dehydratase [Novimethylophilus kurashikiensis]GBG15072.1 multidrug MFS transporter [Novimethylophilus kurashikiensis]
MRFSPRSRILLVFVHDVLATLVSWAFAYLLRFNFSLPKEFIVSLLETLPVVMLLQSAIFLKFGLYRGMWRFASLPDLKRILAAVGVSALTVAAVMPFMHLGIVVPRSVLVLDPLLLVMIMGGSRFAYRAWKEHHLYGPRQLQGEPVIVLGAGDAAVALLKDLERSTAWRVIGLLADKDELKGRQVYGVKVMGSLEQLPIICEKTGVRHAIVAMPSSTHVERRRAVDIANSVGITVLTVPSFDDLVSGKVSVSQVRRVEVEDLLGREPVQLDDAGLHQLIEKRVVMVTGAGGSIGSELCRQIANFHPALLVLFELSEFALYRIEQELAQSFPQLRVACVIGDVKDKKRLDAVVGRYQPEAVFHAAAYKHVPMMEDINAPEALRNNVLGTFSVAEACVRHQVAKFVLISTDKAVNPTNVMGATKRLAEMVCQGLQNGGVTRFVMVRFGNVLGSSGSVIPKFREQIAKGGPVTVTHPEVTRFFMSIPEAAQLVMQAGLMGQGGEIFVLDMGESIRIADLAKEMIRLSGFTEDEIKIVYSGLRPGEKLYEELLADDEHTLPTPHPKLRIAEARKVDEAWVQEAVSWIESGDFDEIAVKRKLKDWVSEYAPMEPGFQTLAVPHSITIH